MKRAIPVVVLSIAGLVPVWRYEPSTPVTTPPASSSSGSSSATGVKGTTVKTEKGPVQVQVTFDGDRITAVRMLQQPNHPQTTAAVPKLVAETLKAQSADIDTVSGATITSGAYRKSLQAAIDANHANPKASTSSSGSASSASGETVSGPTVNTSKGPVQIQVTFDGADEITAVRMLQQPNHPQTTAAVPKLVAETLKAQSADIDTVSGATITSGAYRKSLQAAIDSQE
ncbi:MULTISPECIES: FMN-binding protein [unclassified Streptomyces]|uniref:FMN-binding protein n=1 Tax=unclassified Streptomyces TaxID=2593676 RepID=UPI002259746A|nr:MULTISPECIES: FMN-binding protein [unclassified Streptomyces]MCX4884346.1 FMN-binding protein [Streptomyces sp. NBC_00847]MCX5424466.1 FMN-binding protein [Streptomyces sp. NBC_00078]